MPNSLVKRNQMLDFAPSEFIEEEEINPARIFKINLNSEKAGEIIYLCNREHRVKDNWGLLFAYQKSQQTNQPLRVIFPKAQKKFSTKQEPFMQKGLDDMAKDLKDNSIPFEIATDSILHHLHHAGIVVFDFDPISSLSSILQPIDCAVFEVDSHNIIPARFASQRQEFQAATFRPTVYRNIEEFLTEFPSGFKTATNEADETLIDFIKNKLSIYAEQRNDPNKDAVSELSKYLHFGQISAQRIAIEIIKSNATRENKEAFLEELIVRKELSDNFCLYSQNHDSYEAALSWAKTTLETHRTDMREYLYDLEDFENANTHEELWNACQKQLLNEGKIHGYLRMYWAKKILEWSQAPEDAIQTAIYLNDTYALDGCDPNGYVGVLWAIVGLHDRAFFEREIFGKIRYMSKSGCDKKFDTTAYINKFPS
jgi:deoxyribodipyrimidine photo-lyase